MHLEDAIKCPQALQTTKLIAMRWILRPRAFRPTLQGRMRAGRSVFDLLAAIHARLCVLNDASKSSKNSFQSPSGRKPQVSRSERLGGGGLQGCSEIVPFEGVGQLCVSIVVLQVVLLLLLHPR